MSPRADLMPTASGWRRLSYTSRGGFVDWGHAQPGAVRKLKRLMDGETSDWLSLKKLQVTLSGSPAFVLDFGEEMRKGFLTVGNVAQFVVRRRLDGRAKEAVALAIFQKASLGFEALQASPPFRWVSDKGFSGEDLVSDLIGFYGVYRGFSDERMRRIAGEVTVDESLKVWDDHLPNGIGGLKNYRFAPILFPIDPHFDTSWPAEFSGIRPARPGGDWIAVKDRFIDGILVNRGQPLAALTDGIVMTVPPAVGSR
ncbi:hypothetical protein KZX46_02150 (plasmid) [Polymorphobacter sp. PAMC 29334]|uniref:hypothetical protein n=1 Tax=Polymorphobacter sp. PAMC 29334 TaxID=2862331 RepID=UPI001C78C74E|nr:hypothetical protein [Polymorphobacter sp. PAMC 29334]QYE32975.1 hypothetical protein KZX46_02150 [Polymorphobacter sp. PAMC 29334]